jgi:hypothetical protein
VSTHIPCAHSQQSDVSSTTGEQPPQQPQQEEPKPVISIDVFILMHEREISSPDKLAFSKKLRTLGYDPCLHQHSVDKLVSGKEFTQETVRTLLQLQQQWTTEMDEQVVQYVNTICDSTGN